MNFANLFGNKNKQPAPEYFLAVEIHESLIKTALWEILNGEPSVVNLGSFESWEDENSLINGVDLSLEQATKVISEQPKRVIFGFPDSWMEEDKIHPTKIKLITRLCKELGLTPIGAVTINRAIAHYLKKREGVPPTSILLEIYTTKVALSYIYLGEVKNVEEVAKSGDIAHDTEEGLARMDLPNYPARFILTNGTDMMDESQQITAYPWQERLSFKHLPKVEALPVDFSVKAIALIGGTEAVKFMGIPVQDDEPVQEVPQETKTNIIIPEVETPTMEELGFSYEEVAPPVTIAESAPVEDAKYAFQFEEEPIVAPDSFSEDEIPNLSTEKVRKKFQFSFPKITLPKISFPKFSLSIFGVLAIPLLLIVAFVFYLFTGKADVILKFNPQKYNRQIDITISSSNQNPQSLQATPQSLSGSAQETLNTTGQATVGDKAVGTVTIANKTSAPLSLKAGTILTTDNGKYNYTIKNAVTVASASSDLLDIISGKATGVEVVASRIGAEYNLSKDSTFTVDGYSRTIAIAMSEKEFTGGSSRTVNAVSKEDQEKLLALASEKIKQQTQSQLSTQSPGQQIIPVSEINFTKKQFDHNVGEEATSLSIDLEGSMEVLVYSNDQLFQIVQNQISKDIPAGTKIQKESTTWQIADVVKKDGGYQAKVSIDTYLYPVIDETKLAGFIKGKMVNNIRHFFEPIKGFVSAEVRITPALPVITKVMPLKNISFQLVGN